MNEKLTDQYRALQDTLNGAFLGEANGISREDFAGLNAFVISERIRSIIRFEIDEALGLVRDGLETVIRAYEPNQ